MSDDDGTKIAWTVTLIELRNGDRFARLHPSDEWLNKYQLRRLVITLERVSTFASGTEAP